MSRVTHLLLVIWQSNSAIFIAILLSRYSFGAFVMVDSERKEGEAPTIQHSRSPFYQVHTASGSAMNQMDGRIELSFFADRVHYIKEGLVAHPTDPNLMRPNGQIEATLLREHVVGISMSPEGLVGLRDLLNSMVVDMPSHHKS
ncbi:TPA: hypothetical protein I8303_000402 [Aeromonas hydrophila]|nr:hypothetical protein [Aeromonas hydrophila]